MSDPILELLAAPPSPSMSVDEDAVHAGGRRRLRRRDLRRTGIGVVGVVGAAAVAFAHPGLGPGRRSSAGRPFTVRRATGRPRLGRASSTVGMPSRSSRAPRPASPTSSSTR